MGGNNMYDRNNKFCEENVSPSFLELLQCVLCGEAAETSNNYKLIS